uniref:Myotubularin phosphatase domain-containing protein n=1 Tax=Angiostrongylus cantonensis TaxID=6313 RepID=A0A0K0DBI4_ANGCA
LLLQTTAVSTNYHQKANLEANGLDLSAVVSSLVQICCDRYYRNLDALSQIKWIGLGHPFAERLLGIPNGSNEAVIAPTFLLFLDCLAQLIRLYPMQFSYTQYALIALWDLSLTGIVPAFCASSVGDQLSSNRCGGPFPLERFFHESYTRLFSNVTNTAALIFVSVLCQNPLMTLADIMLWNECYMRWIPSANWGPSPFMERKSRHEMSIALTLQYTAPFPDSLPHKKSYHFALPFFLSNVHVKRRSELSSAAHVSVQLVRVN